MSRTLITLHGMPGTGKSTLGRLLQKNFLTDFDRVSIGDIARTRAEKIIKERELLHMDFNTFPAYARANGIPFDELNDEELKSIERTGEKKIIDCRLGFHFIPSSFKVLVVAPLEIVAQRIFTDPNRTDNKDSFESLLGRLIARKENDRKKYLELYGVDYMNSDNYDCIIDTEKYNQSQSTGVVYKEYRLWSVGKHQKQII